MIRGDGTMSRLETPTLRQRLNDEAFETIFRAARTYNGWLDKPVSDETVREVYNLMKWGPTSADSSPARFLLLRSKAAKERLRPALAPGNVPKTMSAPVTAIVAYDLASTRSCPSSPRTIRVSGTCSRTIRNLQKPLR